MSAVPSFALVVDALPDPTLLVTHSGRVVHLNRAAARVLPGCAAGDALAACGPAGAEAAERLQVYLVRCASSRMPLPGAFAFGGTPYRLEGSVLRPARADADALVLLRLTARAEAIDRFALLTQQIDRLAREVRERKRAETALREVNEALRDVNEALREAKNAAEAANRSKSQFLASMSHEIRTPLTSVLGFAAVLAREVEAPHREFALLIERSGRRLLNTLDAVLTLAKLEANRLDLTPTPLVLTDEVLAVTRLFEEQAEMKGIDIRFDAAPDAVGAMCRIDQGALFSVLQNLVSNAIKFTTQGSIDVTVTRTVEADETQWLGVDVRDTGIGIDPAFLPYLFDSFSQESAGHSRTHEGTGLGLAITKRLVELMDGRLEVHSEKGRGTTFSVAFPEHTAVPVAAPPVASPVPQRPFRVLIVEDHEPARYLLADLLEEHGEVTVAATAEEAVTAIEREVFDVALIDIHLGTGPDGMSILDHLRRRSGARTAAAAVTAYALPGDRDRFLSLGFDAYLAKPFTADNLLALVASLLETDPSVG